MGGAVLPSARGRGVYRALVHARLGPRGESWTPLLVVQAGRMSAPVLAGLGFASHGEIRPIRRPAFRTYEASPSCSPSSTNPAPSSVRREGNVVGEHARARRLDAPPAGRAGVGRGPATNSRASPRPTHGLGTARSRSRTSPASSAGPCVPASPTTSPSSRINHASEPCSASMRSASSVSACGHPSPRRSPSGRAVDDRGSGLAGKRSRTSLWVRICSAIDSDRATPARLRGRARPELGRGADVGLACLLVLVERLGRSPSGAWPTPTGNWNGFPFAAISL